MAMMEHRRTWTLVLDGTSHEIVVIYAALLGWMSIEVDGTRRARAWREWQTVFGGAVLSCELGTHRVDARVTQPYGRQEYAFALSVDGEIQPGSDPQPGPRALKRQTLRALGWLAVIVAITTFLAQILARLG